MAERIALLDVNVLIALVDPRHVHHEPSHRWFEAHGGHGWATCPLTQNALLRILGNPRYSNSPAGPALVMPLLQGLLGHPAHVFWPDVLSWDAAGVFVGDGLLHHGQCPLRSVGIGLQPRKNQGSDDGPRFGQPL